MKKIILFNFILFFVSITNAQWIKETPSLSLADFDNIRKITYVDKDNGWLITSYRLFHTTNGGNSWNEQIVIPPPSDKSFSDIKFFNSNDGVLINNSDLYKSSDRGNSWERIGYSPNGFQFIDPNVWFRTDNYTISKSTDAGKTWTELIRFDYLVNSYFYDISTGYAYGRINSSENPSIYHTYDGGITWNKGNIIGISSNTSITNIQFTSKDQGFAIIPDSLRIIKTVDGGKNWIMKSLSKTYLFDWLGINGGKWSLKFFNDLVGFILVPPPYYYPDGIILRTLDGGETWEKYPAYGIGKPNDIFFSQDNTTLIVSAGHDFLKTSLLSPIQKSISIISPANNEIIRSNQKIILKWENKVSQDNGNLVCALYKLINSHECALISTDTVSSSQTELQKKISINNDSKVLSTLFYRVYNPNKINSEDISEKFFVRIPPKISLEPITNSSYLFIGDSLTINFISYAVDKIKIQYSTNGGAEWLDVSNIIQSDSNKILGFNYKWMIPSTPSENCLLRIISTFDPKVLVSSSPFIISAQKEIALFPMKKGNAWFYKHHYNSYGSGTLDAPNNIYYIIRTGDEILKDDGFNYFPFDRYIWDRNSGNSDKFNYVSTVYYRQYQNKIYTYGSEVAQYDFSAKSNISTIFNRELKTFRYGTEVQWEIIADSIGLIEFGSTAPVYAGYYERNYLVSAIVNGIVYGDTSKVTGIIENPNQIPTKYSLSQNYPNPFNPTTKIEYSIPITSFVTIKMYDVLGKEIETLLSEEKIPGNYTLQFDGRSLSNGVYFYRMKARDYVETKKLLLLK